MDTALQNGTIDRFLYPDYRGFIWRLNNSHEWDKNTYKIAKVFHSPFQIGMVLSMLPKLVSPEDVSFLRCLRTGVSSLDRLVR